MARQQHDHVRRRKAVPVAPQLTEAERIARLSGLVRQLRERERKLRSRLDRANLQLEMVGEQMAAAFMQMDAHTETVVAAAEFRALAGQELDVESAIALLIDSLSLRFGATNVVVWLSSSRGEYATAGYGYYDVPRTLAEATLGVLADEVCPALGVEAVPHTFDDGREVLTVPPPGGGVLEGRSVILCPIAYRGEALGAIMLFRSQQNPWPAGAPETTAAIGEAFGEQLDRIIRVANRTPDRWPAMDSED